MTCINRLINIMALEITTKFANIGRKVRRLRLNLVADLYSTPILPSYNRTQTKKASAFTQKPFLSS